jgi:tetratricopeptide (TPR) repeat protein
VQPEQALIIAAAIVNFSNLIRSFPYGNIAINLEIAIAGCKVVAPILTRETFPEFWAITQNMLDAIYRIRIAGDRAQNLEQAIVYYQNALQIRTQTDFSEKWAEPQNNLANAYGERIKGDRAENIEAAITAFQAALQIYTRSSYPQDWAIVIANVAKRNEAIARTWRPCDCFVVPPRNDGFWIIYLLEHSWLISLSLLQGIGVAQNNIITRFSCII